MTLTEGLTALAVLAGIGWVVFSGVAKKDPTMVPRIKRFMETKKEKKNPFGNTKDRLEQVYDERRSMV